MIPVHPVSLRKYLRKKKTSVKKGIGYGFYLSWEDALWDILRSYSVPRNSVVLVPSFFCMDVVRNMKTHGLNSVFYTLDKNLHGNEKEVVELIRKHNPRVLILFHPVGIRSSLMESDNLFRCIPANTILIEDGVHQVIDPGEVEIKRRNHFILTSLRKVVPLPGSILFGGKEDVMRLKGPVSHDSFYIFRVISYWILMQFFLSLQKHIPLNRVKKESGKTAENFMLKAYDLIGDSYMPAMAPSLFLTLYFHMDFEKIEKTKRSQVNQYRHTLNTISQGGIIRYVPFHKKDEGKLRGFPIIINKEKAEVFIRKIREEGIYIRKELEECPWAKAHTIAYLPLGVHISEKHINYVADKVNKYSRIKELI